MGSPEFYPNRTLGRIVRAATRLTGAGSGVLGVLGPDGQPADAVHFGADGAVPTGQGVLGVPVRARGEILGRLSLWDKRDGRSFTPHDEVLARILAGVAGIALDNARLHEQARRQRWWAAGSAATTELLGAGDTIEILRLIAGNALELSGADHIMIALPDAADQATELTVVVSAGVDSDTITGRTMPVPGSTAGAVLTDRTPRVVPGLTLDPAGGPGAEFGPAAVLPLRSGDSVAGVLLAVRAAGAPGFADQALGVVSSFADQAALALQWARNQDARRELVVLADRDRIAADLHDQVIQRLYAIGLSLRRTERRTRAPLVAERITGHIDQLQEVIEEIRTTIADLQENQVRRIRDE